MIRVETTIGPAELHLDDGRVLFTKTRTIHRDDWRDTPVGRCNFGSVQIGPVEDWVREADGTERRVFRGVHVCERETD